MNAQLVQGLDELRIALYALPAKLRNQVLRNALAAGARVVRDEAKRLVPVLRSPVVQRSTGKTIRMPGTVRDAIRVRTSKASRRAGHVGVFVNVKPAGKGHRGAASASDPYYWRWLEFGRKSRAAVSAGWRRKAVRWRRGRALRAVGAMKGYRFLRGAVDKSDMALNKIIKTLGPAIARMNRKRGTL